MFENARCSINGRGFTGNDNTIAVYPDGDGNVLFDCREILIEFAEQPDMVV